MIVYVYGKWVLLLKLCPDTKDRKALRNESYSISKAYCND
jgi:hypothetical protein